MERKDYRGVTTPVEYNNGHIKATTKTVSHNQGIALSVEMDTQHDLLDRWGQCQLPQGAGRPIGGARRRT